MIFTCKFDSALKKTVLTFCLNEFQIDIPADADNVVRFDVEVDDAIVVHEHNSGDNLVHRIGDFTESRDKNLELSPSVDFKRHD